MATKLARVKVTPIEGGAEGGARFSIVCSCGSRMLRRTRIAADLAADAHRRSHVTPDPADQVL